MKKLTLVNVMKDNRPRTYMAVTGANGDRALYSVYLGCRNQNTSGEGEVFYSAGRWLVKTKYPGTMRIPKRQDLENFGVEVEAVSREHKLNEQRVREAFIEFVCNSDLKNPRQQ